MNPNCLEVPQCPKSVFPGLLYRLERTVIRGRYSPSVPRILKSCNKSLLMVTFLTCESFYDNYSIVLRHTQGLTKTSGSHHLVLTKKGRLYAGIRNSSSSPEILVEMSIVWKSKPTSSFRTLSRLPSNTTSDLFSSEKGSNRVRSEGSLLNFIDSEHTQ